MVNEEEQGEWNTYGFMYCLNEDVAVARAILTLYSVQYTQTNNTLTKGVTEFLFSIQPDVYLRMLYYIKENSSKVYLTTERQDTFGDLLPSNVTDLGLYPGTTISFNANSSTRIKQLVWDTLFLAPRQKLVFKRLRHSSTDANDKIIQLLIGDTEFYSLVGGNSELENTQTILYTSGGIRVPNDIPTPTAHTISDFLWNYEAPSYKIINQSIISRAGAAVFDFDSTWTGLAGDILVHFCDFTGGVQGDSTIALSPDYGPGFISAFSYTYTAVDRGEWVTATAASPYTILGAASYRATNNFSDMRFRMRVNNAGAAYDQHCYHIRPAV